MKLNGKHIIAVGLLALTLLSGCGTTKISSKNKDTTGAYNGTWLGSVEGPRATREIMPGNWYMSCAWDPFKIRVFVNDGVVQLGRSENKEFISSKGNFRFEISSGEAGMTGGVMTGGSKFVNVYSGNLAAGELDGKYYQYVTSIGGVGCNAKIKFRKI